MRLLRTVIFIACLLLCKNISAQTYLLADSNKNVTAKDYKASMFGIKSNGSTLNTRSIQKAIDFIHEQGGGRLVFYVGRYLTGAVRLKSNVVIHLEEGAVLVCAGSIYNYGIDEKNPALVIAQSATNTGITGKGVIEGNGITIAKSVADQASKGFIDSSKIQFPALVKIDSSKNVLLSVQNFIDVGATAIVVQNSSNIKIDSATIKSIQPFKQNAMAIDISNSENIMISNCYFDTQKPYVQISSDAKNVVFEKTVSVNGELIENKDGKLQFTPIKSRPK